MNPYIQSLKARLASSSPDYGDGDISTLLEFLWQAYTDRNPISNDRIRALFLKLEPIFAGLPPQDCDALFDTVSSLCAAHERAAFLEGIRVGARLAMELGE